MFAKSYKEAPLNFPSIDSLQSAMRERNYIAERGLATSFGRAKALPQFVEVRSSGLRYTSAKRFHALSRRL